MADGQYLNPDVAPRFDLDAPLEPVIYARSFLDVLMEEGIDPGRVLDGTGLSVLDLAEPGNRMSVHQQLQIYANAARLSSRPGIGLENGRRIEPWHHGVWGYAMQTSKDLGHAIRIFNEFFDLVGPIARQVLRVEGSQAHWISVDIIAAEPARQVGLEEMLSGNLQLCRSLTGEQFHLNELHLDYEAPEALARYEDFFECPVHMGCPRTQMCFDASMLNLKLKSADPETESLSEERCRELMQRLDEQTGFAGQVRRAILESPCDKRSLDDIAALLFVSPRTLRRRLTQANTSFRTLVAQVHQDMAEQYLQDTQLPVEEIAFLLGYSDASNFSHAFKQWTGSTPIQFRESFRA